MRIYVCVKQVPDTTEIKIDPVTNTLIRKGVPSIVNPFDGYAVEAAARIRDKNPDTKIVVLSMGPDQAKAAAFAHANVSEWDTAKLKVEFDQDHGRAEYDVEFDAGNTEYEYKIDAVTGEVISYETDRD